MHVVQFRAADGHINPAAPLIAQRSAPRLIVDIKLTKMLIARCADRRQCAPAISQKCSQAKGFPCHLCLLCL